MPRKLKLVSPNEKKALSVGMDPIPLHPEQWPILHRHALVLFESIQIKPSFWNPDLELILFKGCLKNFNSHFEPQSPDYRRVNTLQTTIEEDLRQLLFALPRYYRRFPLVVPFLEAYRLQIEPQVRGPFILNKAILVNLHQYTSRLFNEFHNFDYGEHKERYLTPSFYNTMAALAFFNHWFNQEAIDLHQFALPALHFIERHWHPLLQTLQQQYFQHYFEKVQTANPTFRSLITTYHNYLEKQLEPLRVTVNHHQTQYALLSEQFLDLTAQKSSMSQHLEDPLEAQIEAILDEKASQQEAVYKKTLDKIAGICHLDPVLKAVKKKEKGLKALSAQIIHISHPTPLSKVKKPEASEVTIPFKPEIVKIPLITTHLLELKTLQRLNKDSEGLYKALKDSSFYDSGNVAYKKKLLTLIKGLNHCFISPHLADELALQNSCLQNLIIEMQHSPILAVFEREWGLREKLQEFIVSYGEALETELLNLQEKQAEINHYFLELQEKTALLKKQLPQKVLPACNTHHEQPYKKALLDVVSTLLTTQEFYVFPQLIPVCLKMLEHSYHALAQGNELTLQPSHEASNRSFILEKELYEEKEDDNPPPVLFRDPLFILKKKALQTALEQQKELLTWPSLQFLYEYTQVLLVQYSHLAKEKSYFPSAKRRKYLHFCAQLKTELEAFHEHFALTKANKPLQAANASLQAIIKMLSGGYVDCLSYEFYKIYQDEIACVAPKENTLVLLDWPYLLQLHATAVELLPEIEQFDARSFGYFKQAPLLAGAIKYFNSLFDPKKILQNEELDKSFAANKALLVILGIINRDRENLVPSTLNQIKLQFFIVQYHHYVKASIKLLKIDLNKEEFYKKKLQQKILQLGRCNPTDYQHQRILKKQIAATLKKFNKESLCLKALDQILPIPIPPSCPLEEAFSGARHQFEQLQQPSATAFPVFTPKLFKGDAAPFEDEVLEIVEIIPFLTKEALLKLYAESDYLLSKLSIYKYDCEKLEDLFAATKLFRACFSPFISSEAEANHYLDKMILGINHSLNLKEFNEDLRWGLMYFLSHYSQVLTHYLQDLRRMDSVASFEAERLTKRIDRLRQEHRQQASIQPLRNQQIIQEVLQEEATRGNPALQTLHALAAAIFKVNDPRYFPLCIEVLKATFAVFSPLDQQAPDESISELTS